MNSKHVGESSEVMIIDDVDTFHRRHGTLATAFLVGSLLIVLWVQYAGDRLAVWWNRHVKHRLDCPLCRTEASSELTGEWDAWEFRFCHACGHVWNLIILGNK